MKYLVLLGRILYSSIFVMSAFGHFSSQTIGYAASVGVPFASIAVPLSGVMAILGGLSVAFGFKAKYGAVVLALFLIPVTFMMHNFWAVPDPMMARMQQAMFFKNFAMLGSAFLISYFGSGPLSLDSVLSARRVHITRTKHPVTA
ncbi:MAG TPA: DoxX family protein [Bacteroidota bacterium]|jgi:putative oxidoreductase